MQSPSLKDFDTLKVVASNELIRSSFKLSKRALIFGFYLISRVDSMKSDDFTDFLFTYQQVTAIVNFDGKRRISKRKEVHSLIKELRTSPIFREDAYDKVDVTRISSLTYHKQTDQFRFRIDPALKPHLLNLKNYFTEFFYRYIAQMEFPNSMILYALLKSYHA